MRQAARRTLPSGLVGAALIGVCALVLPEPLSAAAGSSREQPGASSPWRKSPLHSSGDASRLTALLPGRICPIFSLVAPCQAGASPLSVQRGVSPRAASTPTPVPAAHRALLDRYCVTCHNDRLRTGGLSFEADSFHHVSRDTEAWEKVIRKLRSATMPPAGRPRPEPARYTSFAAWLEATVDAAAAEDPWPGRPTARRLNRTEYTNAIRDLLGLEIDGRALLPADDRAYGFDNNADMLPMSTALLERYLSAAAGISRLAVGDPALPASVTTYNVSRLRLQAGRAGPDLPFGSRGGAVVRHYFPLDAEYVVTARLRRRRFREPQQLDLRLDGERLELFQLGGPRRPPSADPPSRAPDEPLAVRLRVTAGSHRVAATFVGRMVAPEGVRPAYFPVGSISFGGVRGAEARVEAIDVAGPYDPTGAGDTASRRRIFVCRPADEARGPEAEACAREILSALATRAYRRPVAERELDTLLRFYREGREEGGAFDAGIQLAIERILLDASFLVRVERDPVDAPAGAAYRLGDLEIASRLSFFLWSSLPDDELLAAAAAGQLGDPATLRRQVRRLLDDPRAKTLVTDFASQWLHLGNLRAAAPDVNAFPEFDDDLREAFQRETELFLEVQLREDRGLLELLTADYTFVNERLARHYGLDGVHGSHFRRVTLGDDRRAGLLGHGSILTVTSYANRTSPVVRGKWLLENVLGAPPPPPPPDVPPLEEADVSGARSMRERMERHRANPVCASCHAQMDPLGFALENFDAVGRWRDAADDGGPIDAVAALPDGSRFEGPGGLRRMLGDRGDELVSNVTARLMTYALGRGVEAHDMPAIRKIVREAQAGGYRWSSIILGVVESTPFLMRSTEP